MIVADTLDVRDAGRGYEFGLGAAVPATFERVQEEGRELRLAPEPYALAHLRIRLRWRRGALVLDKHRRAVFEFKARERVGQLA